MALAVGKIVDLYTYLFDDLADPRVKEWFLMGSVGPILLLIGFYLYFVLNLGPRLMKNRQPFDLEKLIIVYNAIQVVICFYLCVQVFFVLRKKNNQVSFLHVYHHTGMCLLGWGGTKYIAGGHGVFMGFLNSLVHVVMYFYYLLSAWDKQYKKNVWWKKHITQLQLAQFFILIIYFGQLLIQPNCKYPAWTALIFIPQNVFMIILFSKFYYKNYVLPEKRAKAAKSQAREELKAD